MRIEFTYTAGEDNLEQTLRELDELFPRWYHRHWNEMSALGEALTVADPGRGKGFEETVRDYLRQELCNHADDERAEVLALAEGLLKEVQA